MKKEHEEAAANIRDYQKRKMVKKKTEAEEKRKVSFSLG